MISYFGGKWVEIEVYVNTVKRSTGVLRLRKGTVCDGGVNIKAMKRYLIQKKNLMIKLTNLHSTKCHYTLHLEKTDLISQNRPFKLVMMFRSPTSRSLTLHNSNSWKLCRKNKMINQTLRMKNFKISCLKQSKEAHWKSLKTFIHIFHTSRQMTWIKTFK